MNNALHPESRPLHVSLIAIPDAVVSTLSGIFDVMNAFKMLPGPDEPPPFRVDIVGPSSGPLELASGVPVTVQRSIHELPTTDIIIVPSILLPPTGWEKHRYPELVTWLTAMHDRGAILCSACSGLFLLAETGLFDGMDSTIHYGYAEAFSKAYPTVPIYPEQVLVVSGQHEELISSGASMTWHDLVLYLISRYVGVTAAQDVARFFALQWHQDGLAPYMVFEGEMHHGDSAIRSAQEWLSDHFSVAAPVDEMIKRTGLTERTFKRRFTNATGLPPIVYVQRLRVEDAKRRLERTETSIDEISWQVGYEDPAFFRRLFKRTTGLTPGTYRRRFQIPDFVRATLESGAGPVR